jgi:glycosyltransferase involved in cell wall biosynthesis
VDKGYDTFIKVAKKLSMFNPRIRFHVVGNFSRDDIDVDSLGNNITYYGVQPTTFFPQFYSEMDLILSPNLPFKLAPGAFDGFPTGACTEAGINGVAVFCTDVLNDNLDFTDGEEIVIVTPDPDEITRKIMEYFCEPEKLALLASRGQVRFQEVNNTEKMLRPRFRLLTEYI